MHRIKKNKDCSEMIDSVVHTLDFSRFVIKSDQQRNDAAVVFLTDFSAGGRMFLGLVIHPIVLLAISQKYCTFWYLYLQN